MKKTVRPTDLINRLPENISDNVSENPPTWITEVKPLITNPTVKMYYAGGGDIKIISAATGKEYMFVGGIPTDVDIVDADYFSTLKKESGCCGNHYTIQLFEKA